MSAQTYTSVPTDIDAIQWTGDNAGEILAFVGRQDGWDLFLPPGLAGHLAGVNPEDSKIKAALFVAANDAWLLIDESEWVAKDTLGFHPIKAEVFERKYREKKIADLGPFHVVNALTGKHMGPFTTDNDAALARAMSSDEGWRRGTNMPRARFDQHLADSAALGYS